MGAPFGFWLCRNAYMNLSKGNNKLTNKQNTCVSYFIKPDTLPVEINALVVHVATEYFYNQVKDYLKSSLADSYEWFGQTLQTTHNPVSKPFEAWHQLPATGLGTAADLLTLRVVLVVSMYCT